MLATVELDDQLMIETGEIDDVTPDGSPPTKLCAVQLAASNAIPEALVDLGLIFAKLAGENTSHAIRLT